jgi:hypothetical protein
MWRGELKRQKLSVIYFDAYAADYFNDPFICFSREILHLAEERFMEGKGLVAHKEFKKTAVEVGKRLAGLAVKVALKSATLGILEETHLEDLKESKSEIASGIGEIGAKTIEKKIEDYTAEKDALAAFKGSLAKLAAVVREEQGFPLTIIVDELDRCRPDFALALLERMKHLFDVEGVAFVLLVNRDQIESYIRKVYGDVDARAYLLKFANVFVDLPHQGNEFQVHYQKGRREYAQSLVLHHGFFNKVRDGRYLSNCLEVLVDHFALTLREIEKVIAGLALYYSSVLPNDGGNELLVATLSIVKVKKPQLYEGLRAGRIPFEEFFRTTQLDQIRVRAQPHDQELIKKVLSICLMSDVDFERALNAEKQADNTQISLSELKRWFPGDRATIIPALCSKLDRFAFKP